MQKCNVCDIFKGLDFSEKEKDLAEEKFEELFPKKGDVLLTPGQPVTHQYFVLSGCLRTYHITPAGKEYTLQFAVTDWWISDYTAFFTGGESMFYIDCVKDAVVYKIAKDNMEQLYTQVPQIESFFRVKMERFFASFQKRILADLALTAEEKYLRFIKSYLGITTESLSRVRHELARK